MCRVTVLTQRLLPSPPAPPSAPPCQHDASFCLCYKPSSLKHRRPPARPLLDRGRSFCRGVSARRQEVRGHSRQTEERVMSRSRLGAEHCGKCATWNELNLGLSSVCYSTFNTICCTVVIRCWIVLFDSCVDTGSPGSHVPVCTVPDEY